MSVLHAEQPVGHAVHLLVPLSAIVPKGQELAVTHEPVVLSKKLVTQDVQFEAVVHFPQGLTQAVQVQLLLK